MDRSSRSSDLHLIVTAMKQKVYEASIKTKQEVSKDTYEITFALTEDFVFIPGQYIWVILPQLAFPDPKGDRRAFSISSGFQNKREVSVLFRASDSGYKKSLLAMDIGDRLSIKGPRGQSFTLDGNIPHVCFIAGGVGVAPFLSIIRSYQNLPFKPKITLINLNSDVPRKFLTAELKRYASEGTITLIDNTGPFTVGLLVAFLKTLPDARSAAYYICGPQAMVDVAYSELTVLGIAKDQLRFEQFYPTPKYSLKGLAQGPESREDRTYESVDAMKSNFIRTRFIYYYYAGVCLMGTIAGVLLLRGSSLGDTSGLYIAILALAVNFVLIKIAKNFNYLVYSTVALTAAIILCALWFGSFGGLAVYMLYFFPIIALFALGKRAGVISVLVYGALVSLVFVMSYAGVSPHYYSVTVCIFSIIGLVLTSLISFFAVNITDSITGKLGEAVSLRESYKLAVESSSNHTIITDTNGKIIYANKAAQKVTGYTFTEMVGNTPRLWGGQMSSEFYRNMWKLKKDNKGFFVGEVKNVKKDGVLYTAIARISPILDTQGNLLGFVATEEDITVREELETSLRTKLDELARLNRLMVGRELKMRELKKEIANIKGVSSGG